jgi:hypothetical protein
MIIGEEFAWAHLPKAGGDTTHAMFGAVPRLVLHADPSDSNAKHTLFSERRDAIAGKSLFMNIRRLPTWMLSYCQYTSLNGLYPDFTPRPMFSPREMAESGIGDQHLSWFTDEGRLEIACFLRTEHLVADFMEVVSRFAALSDAERAAVEEIGVRNSLDYDRDLRSWFTPDHLDRMYNANPVWARVEKNLYGEIVEL